MTDNEMTTQERIDTLKDAQELIREAVGLIEDALRGTRLSTTASAYLVPALEQAIDNESEWLGSNPGNIGGLIESLMDDDNEPGYDEQPDVDDSIEATEPGYVGDGFTNEFDYDRDEFGDTYPPMGDES